VTYQSPGVYIEEVPSGPQPIAAASTSVMAVLGSTRKGPVLTPTRVTGWSDFVRTFGAASGRGFAAESVFGFFENGGPAAWVVRLDRSVAATWQVIDGQNAPRPSFVATAASPGAWAQSVGLAVAPDLSGGQATIARAVVAAGTAVPAGPADIPVSGGGGLSAGDSVLLTSQSATSAATITAVTPTQVSVTNTGAAISLAVGDVIALTTANAPGTLTFAAGSGIKAGDLLVLQAPNGSRTDALVAAATQTGATLSVTLAAPLGAPVVAAAYARRRAIFTGTTSGNTGGTLPFSRITWDLGAEVTPRNADSQLANARVTLADGSVATWSGITFALAGGGDAPAGPVSAEAEVRVATWTSTVSFTPASIGDVLGQFSFLPVGTAIALTDGVTTVTVNRTGSGVTDGDGTKTGPAFGATFTTAGFVLPADASRGVVVRCAVAPRVGEYVVFAAAKTLRISTVVPVGGDAYVLGFADTTSLTGETGGDAGRFAVLAVAATQAMPARFSLTVTVDGAFAETFTGLALDPGHPAYFAKDGVVNGVSAYVTLAPRAAGAPAVTAVTMPARATRTQNGVDVAATAADYADALTALEAVPEPAMVIAPDTVALDDPLLQADLIGKIVTHCETFRRFAIVDAPDKADDAALLAWRNTTLSSTCAAVYAPHLTIVTINPESIDRYTTVPPSGFVAGVFARTDRERGVHKAPGNERVTGAVALAQQYTERRQDLLNPASVNLIRAFPGRGTRIWGARTASDDVTWRYVNVRRLFHMVETSVDSSTQWVVFEPNTASTWIRVKVSVENFLDQLWRSGALAGTKPDDAYRVRVGLGETMTETDIDLGLIITEVALAPAKPAEFVVFRFSHKRLSE
jgi:phage tail sheath protein FI